MSALFEVDSVQGRNSSGTERPDLLNSGHSYSHAQKVEINSWLASATGMAVLAASVDQSLARELVAVFTTAPESVRTIRDLGRKLKGQI